MIDKYAFQKKLEEWTKESPPLSPKLMQFPVCWPLDDLAQSEAPFATREWAQRLLFDRVAGKIAFPERTRAALQRYCESISALTIQRQRTTNQPATPASPPTRPKPPQSTTQAKQGGGNRTLVVEWQPAQFHGTHRSVVRNRPTHPTLQRCQ